jgi:hypothetical protein
MQMRIDERGGQRTGNRGTEAGLLVPMVSSAGWFGHGLAGKVVV